MDGYLEQFAEFIRTHEEASFSITCRRDIWGASMDYSLEGPNTADVTVSATATNPQDAIRLLSERLFEVE
jgi:hypothetical protein